MLTALSRRREGGFTLVEVLVAITLFGLVAAAIVPLLAISGSAAVATRMHTRAKNLAQERLELMRQLPYQVDEQNGPFIDLLDYYYPNRTAASGTAPGWVSSTATNRISGEPGTGSYYRTRFDTLPGQPGFRQVVAVQFLDLARNPVADARFATYRHDVAGLDSAPSTLVAVTVLTYWNAGGGEKLFKTYTQIGDTGGVDGLLTSQAAATFLRLESAIAADDAITSEALAVTADGRLSDGSTSSVRAVAGRATRTGTADVIAASGEAVSPATCSGTGCPDQQPGSASSGPVPSSPACSQYAVFGRTRADGLTSTADGGRPRVPADISTVTSSRARASLLRENGSSCAALGFNNKNGAADATLMLDPSSPVVVMAGDGSSSGSTPIATAEAFLDASPEEAASRYVRAHARTGSTVNVRFFPTTFAPEGVLKVQLDYASITCDSAVTTPVATYRVRVQYWDGSSYRDLSGTSNITWSSGSSFTDPFASVSMSSKSLGSSGRTLADYFPQPPKLATQLAEGSTNGVASIGAAAVSLTTAPVRAGDPLSTIGVKIGQVSCVAVDER